jgi:hypothetical protein
VSTLLSKLGKTVPPRASHKLLMDELVKALASEPDIIITTQWEANCQTCSDLFKEGKVSPKPAGAKGLRGMTRFPQLSNGTHDSQTPCPTDPKHGFMVAQARIAGFKKLA